MALEQSALTDLQQFRVFNGAAGLDMPLPTAESQSGSNHVGVIPERFPLVHPSPLNFRWQAKNPWFISEVLPKLRTQVRDALGHSIHFA